MAVEFKMLTKREPYPAILRNGQHVGALVKYNDGWKEYIFRPAQEFTDAERRTIADKLDSLNQKHVEDVESGTKNKI